MAKRKRLSPAQPDYLAAEGDPARMALAAPPIAQVAGEASAVSALREVSETLAAARDEGRLVQKLPLAAIDTGYLTRDRMVMEPDELEALRQSILTRGQQTPIEVVDLGDGRYGLISGLRRVTVLRDLASETAGIETVQAIVRTPETAAAAYVSMVEENEIRAGLSYFERARIVVKAVEAEIFRTTREALQTLFQSASRARRSKIGGFMPVVSHLGGDLRFPAALPERLGLQLGRALEEEGAERFRAALTATGAETAEAEQEVLRAVLAAPPAPNTAAPPASEPAPPPEESAIAEGRETAAEPLAWQVTPRLRLARAKGGLFLSGADVDPIFEARLRRWLETYHR